MTEGQKNTGEGSSDRLNTLLAQVFDRDRDKQAEALDKICREHPDLAEQLRGAYQNVQPSEEFEETVSPPPAAPGPLEKVGPYKILDVLGEGGMGTVYLAEQKEPVRRRVALKVIKIGMDTKTVLNRFEAERQALAMMEHSCIAKVLEAGTTDGGRPYFVMEYVKGKPITKYCDDNKLSIENRLGLFRQVCSGVQHAHQKGIIHRDLKPANVLVTVEDRNPIPKIIDFGLARATDHRLTEATIYTEQGQIIGTPEYMSPEQADLDELDIDVRTDIYSLGVLLYELLVGEVPFTRQELRKAGLLGIQRMIRETDPPKPSTRLSSLASKIDTARLRRTNRQTLLRRLRGDLDWIVMKALEKDRVRRYGTPNELSADLERHLNHEAVLAGRPSLVYRLRKFSRKHRGKVVAASLLLISLIVGLLGTLQGMFEAHREAKRAGDALRQVEKAERIANARRLLAESTLALGRDPSAAMLLALEASKIAPGQDTSQAAFDALRACREVRRIPLGTRDISAFALSPDGTRLLYREKGKLVAWDLTTGRRLREFRPVGESGRFENPSAPVFDPTGERVLMVEGDGITVWSIDDFGPPGRWDFKHNVSRKLARWLVFVRGDKKVAAISRLGAEFFDAQTGAHEGAVSGLFLGGGDESLSSDRKWVLASPSNSSLSRMGRLFGLGPAKQARLSIVDVVDLLTGKRRARIRTECEWAVLSPDGKFVATVAPPAFEGQRITLWNASSGQKVYELDAITSRGGPRFTDDSKMLFAETLDGQLGAYTVDPPGRLIRRFAGTDLNRGLGTDMRGSLAVLALHPRNRFVAVQTGPVVTRLFNVEDGGDLGVLNTGGAQVSDAHFTADGERLVVQVGSSIRILRLASWAEQRTQKLPERDQHRFGGHSFGPAGRLLAFPKGDEVVVLDAVTGEQRRRFKLADSTRDWAVRVQLLAVKDRILVSPAKLRQRKNPPSPPPLHVYESSTGRLILALKFGGHYCVSPSGVWLGQIAFGRANIYSTIDGRRIATIPLQPSKTEAPTKPSGFPGPFSQVLTGGRMLLFTEDERRLICCIGQKAWIVETMDWSASASINHGIKWPAMAALLPDGQSLLVVSDKDRSQERQTEGVVLDMTTGRVRNSFSGRPIQPSSDGHRVLVSSVQSGRSSHRVHDSATGQLLSVRHTTADPNDWASLTPDGRFVLSNTVEGDTSTLTVADAETGVVTAVVPHNAEDSYMGVTYSADGSIGCVSGFMAATILDLHSGGARYTIRSGLDEIMVLDRSVLSLSDNGDLLLLTFNSYMARVYPTDPVSEARRSLPRQLTIEERNRYDLWDDDSRTAYKLASTLRRELMFADEVRQALQRAPDISDTHRSLALQFADQLGDLDLERLEAELFGEALAGHATWDRWNHIAKVGTKILGRFPDRGPALRHGGRCGAGHVSGFQVSLPTLGEGGLSRYVAATSPGRKARIAQSEQMARPRHSPR